MERISARMLQSSACSKAGSEQVGGVGVGRKKEKCRAGVGPGMSGEGQAQVDGTGGVGRRGLWKWEYQAESGGRDLDLSDTLPGASVFDTADRKLR